MEKLNYEAGDVVRMKKPHPCGSAEWLIVRAGMDFAMRCKGCGHLVIMPRKTVEKGTKSLLKKDQEA